MLHMPSATLFSSASPRTYIEWAAHCARRTSAAITWNDRPQHFAGTYRTQADTISGPQAIMYGTPWSGIGGTAMFPHFSPSRAVQHAMPSEAAFNSQISTLGVIIYSLQSGSSVSAVTGAFRNGYSSLGESSGPYTTINMVECSYWDFSIGGPMTTNPMLSSGPVPYSNSGW